MFDICEYQESIILDGVEYAIDSDWRAAYTILSAMEDNDLTDIEKYVIMYKLLFIEEAPPLIEEAIVACMTYLNGGGASAMNNNSEHSTYDKPLYKLSVDALWIFAAVSKVLGNSVKSYEYLHWHDFLQAFYEIGECMFSNIITIRKHKIEGKLTKDEKIYYEKNKQLIDCIYKDKLGLQDLSVEELVALAENIEQ